MHNGQLIIINLISYGEPISDSSGKTQKDVVDSIRFTKNLTKPNTFAYKILLGTINGAIFGGIALIIGSVKKKSRSSKSVPESAPWEEK